MANVVWMKKGASEELPNLMRCFVVVHGWKFCSLSFRPGVLSVTSFKTLFIIKFSSTFHI